MATRSVQQDSQRLDMSNMTLEDDDKNLLFWAAAAGDTPRVQDCLSKKKCNIDRRVLKGRTAVMEAAVRGKQTTFELLVTAGADLTLVDDEGDSCLILAAEGKNRSIVQNLLKQDKVNVNSRGSENRTAVMEAAIVGDFEIYDDLVSAGADILLCDSNGNMCLHLAAQSGSAKIVENSLQKKIDINKRGQVGQTPVMMATFAAKKNVFDLLVTKGADVSLVDANNNGCLMMAVFSGDAAMLKRVLGMGKFEINKAGEKRMTPAMMAALLGNKESFDLLLAAGADLKLQNEFGNDFLFWGASGGNSKIVKYLLSLKLFDVNRQQEHGLSPLHIAITKGHKEVFDILVSEKGDVNSRNDQLYNSLMIASDTGHANIVRKLISMNKISLNDREENGWTAVMIAAKCGHIEVFDVLVSSGADASLVDKDSNDCLMLACIYGQAVMVRHLLSMTMYNINRRGIYGWTPVMAAINEGHPDVFEVLVESGADMTLLDERGSNCLILACMGGNVTIVQQLLSMKVFDLEYKGLDDSAVTAAAREGQTDVVQLLIDEGVTIDL
ncbi:ankyrin repeat domain-containing protein 50-like [Haliotis rufescens]|uniref:ankyrin repeat domain-containing protein 50-like n=1 Tax=Haliotis rufescens TaxID=6454 RepID=UPI00201F2A4B|nr:ankyrin repeat domain-containing protein 50-like [Haliotis rufescens]